MTYEREGDALRQTRELDPAHRLTFRAEAIRQERTGVHARVAVAMNGVTLAYDTMNIEKDADRVHLVNSYAKLLNGIAAIYPKDHAKKEMDDFCEGLWGAYIGNDRAEYVSGATNPKPPTEILADFIIEGGGSIMFGLPERGKSWVLMLMAVSIDAGISTLWPVKQRKVLFINLERSRESIENRLGMVNRTLGLPSTRKLHMMNRRGRSLSDIYSAATLSVREEGDEVICLDSITRAGAGDLNENLTGNRVIDMMNGFEKAWIGIGHTPRSDESHLYGTLMFEAGADIMIRTFSELQGEERGVALLRTKGNDLPPMKQAKAAALRFGQEGLIAVRGASLSEFPDMLMAGSNASKTETVIRYMQEVDSASATEVSRETGVERSLVTKVFTETGLFQNLGRRGREVHYRVAARDV